MFEVASGVYSGGEQLRDWLHVQGMSERAFDRLIEAPAGSTNQWVRGRCKPSIKYANRITTVTEGEVDQWVWSVDDPWMAGRE